MKHRSAHASVSSLSGRRSAEMVDEYTPHGIRRLNRGLEFLPHTALRPGLAGAWLRRPGD